MAAHSPKELERRRLVKESVAEQFGIEARYPGAGVRYKHTAWVDRENRFNAARAKFETQLAEAADSRGKVKDLDRCYSAMRAVAEARSRTWTAATARCAPPSSTATGSNYLFPTSLGHTLQRSSQ